MKTESRRQAPCFRARRSLAFGAQRLSIAALLCLEEADANLDDLTLLDDAHIQPVNLPALQEDLAIFAGNVLKLADAYGHAEVRRRL